MSRAVLVSAVTSTLVTLMVTTLIYTVFVPELVVAQAVRTTAAGLTVVRDAGTPNGCWAVP